MKKWLFIMLALGFAFTNVYAQDDDDDEYEEEEPAPKKKTAPKKKAEEKPAGPSRIGLSVDFDGSSNLVSLVYDMGTGMELGLGLGLRRFQKTPKEGDAQDPVQRVEIVPSISYDLGKGLLNYGIGLSLGVVLEPVDGGRPEGSDAEYTSVYAFPNFYTNVELVKNVSLGLSAGFNIDMPGAWKDGSKDMTISAAARGTVTFYFL